jgi:hypothetical protein
VTPDKLRAWLRVKPAGAVAVQLAAETLTGSSPVSEWSREEIDTEGGADDCATAILGAAQEYADGEQTAQRFLIRWIGDHARPLKVTTHRVRPRDEAPGIAPEAVADPFVRELLRHLDSKEKHTNNALGILTTSYERILKMLSEQLSAALQRERDVREEAHTPAARVELSPEQREETLQRANALAAFTKLLPDAAELAIATIANRVLPKGQGSDHDA